MKIFILHLSDIHIRANKEENPLLYRLDRIVASFNSIAPDASNCIVVVSGDVAFSGKRDEYLIAKIFLSDLKSKIIERIPECTVHFILVPGNHDCDFSVEDSIRDLILNDEAHERLDTSRMEKCLEVQTNYWNFINELDLPYHHDQSDKRAFQIHRKNTQDTALDFHLLNTSLFSRLNERQGSLIYPVELIEVGKTQDETASIAISVLHHPYKWFESTNARELQNALESMSDIILTGHEHEEDQYSRIKQTGEQTEYIEGSVLQEIGDTQSSGFNVLEVDINNNSQCVHHFSWSRKDGRYEEMDSALPFPFIKNSNRLKNTFINTDEFNDKFLVDPGANFTHHAKASLYLEDIFVFPDIRINKLLGEDELGSQRIREQLPSFLIDERRVLLIGPDKCGKTTLSKVLYQSFRNHALVPVYIQGEDIKRPSESHLEKVIKRAYQKQYGGAPHFLDTFRASEL